MRDWRVLQVWFGLWVGVFFSLVLCMVVGLVDDLVACFAVGFG